MYYYRMNDCTEAKHAIPDTAESGPDEGAVLAVMKAAGALEQILDAALIGVGLSMSKFDALERLMRAEVPLTLGDLAGRLHCVRSNVTQLVDRLEAEGLVRRGSCPNDRRAIRAMVTPLGAERHAAGAQAIRVVQEQISVRINAADRKRLLSLLASLTP